MYTVLIFEIKQKQFLHCIRYASVNKVDTPKGIKKQESYFHFIQVANEQILLANGTVKQLSEFVNTANNQSINGTKTFTSNVNTTGFVKAGKDDTLVLIAGVGDR
ncbi:MAG: hypothetical protein EZS28_029369 [Streblomastix strix]|uniref:Uncharacterized protein n=1 Tax=Streblomastix strix TaxID=222440 RepID=A0A5J4UXZ7_9EUKA|nr:MAG: hypothetical protein EZS28_029369 [Streblomastix strix]